MASTKTGQAPLDKNKIDSKWTLMVNFRPRVSKKKRNEIAIEKKCIIVSAITIGSAERVKLLVAKGHPELKDFAHHVMCCVLVPKDGRKRKTVLAEAIKHFESYEKEIFDVRPNVTFSLVKPISEMET